MRVRGGFGIIFGVIVLFLIMMLTMGFAQFVFGSRVANDTQATVVGGLATSIAQSAFEEAWHQISLAANTQGDPLYAQMRKDITDPSQAVFDFKVPVPETLAEIDATEGYSGFKIDGKAVQAEVLGAGTMAGLTYENMGTLKLTARVKHGPTGLARTLTMTRGFKVALLSTPRPFDQTTLFIMNPQQMLDAQGPFGANAKIKDALNVLDKLGVELRKALKDRIKLALDEVNKAADESEGQLERVNVEEYTKIIDDAVVPQAPQYADDVKNERHFFPEAPGDYVIFTLEKEIPDLEQLYVARLIQERQTDFETMRTRWKMEADKLIALCDEIYMAAAKRDEAYKDRVEEFKKRLKEQCEVVKDVMTKFASLATERLDTYKKFTDFFSERSGDGAKELQQFSGKFDVQGGQAGRAFYSYSGAGAAAALKGLMEKYEKQNKPLNAVIHVDAGDKVVALENLRVQGKVVVLVNGRVALANVKLANNTADLLTVHAGGRVTIDGTVQASVVASGDVEMSPGAAMEGNLILYRSDSAPGWRGKLTRDERYKSSMGGAPEEQLQGHVVVALSPRPASLIVDRQ